MITRRTLLASAVTAPLTPLAVRGQGPKPFPGLTVRSQEPRNLEFPVSELKDPIVANEHFFVRSHFPVPKIDPKAWRLKVEGAVNNPLELSLEDLKAMPARSATVTLECAGNGRVHLTPAVPGLQWGQGAVGNAEWSGVPLAAILERAGVRDGAVEVILEGADKGTVAGPPSSPGPISFSRSIPIDKARRPEVLLAHAMNGEPLPASHGFPLRAVVGGWYGMASIKWLTRIVVTDRPFQGFWQTLDYAYFVDRKGGPSLEPVTVMQPKSMLARPGLGEVLDGSKPIRLFGAAWAGERPVARVDVSVDGGKTWLGAKLLAEAKPLQWVFWEWTWERPTRGPASILTRAADDRGATQPTTRDPGRRTYMINHLVPIDVTVR